MKYKIISYTNLGGSTSAQAMLAGQLVTFTGKYQRGFAVCIDKDGKQRLILNSNLLKVYGRTNR